jgi:peptidoglycan/LPS O-acetylase OafA/YrhL
MRHTPQLDGLRAIAILIVMVSHSGLGSIVPGGFGVTIFFFLSGYLITSLLRLENDSTGGVDIRAFYLRRVSRIFPPLYATMAFVILLLASGIVRREVSATAILLDALFLTNYSNLLIGGLGLPIPLWSLNVEEHFYLLFPFVYVAFLKRRVPAKAAFCCLGACVMFLAIRVATITMTTYVDEIFYWTHTRVDSILFGCALALWHNPIVDPKSWRPTLWQTVFAGAVILACFGVREPVFRETVRYTLQGVGLFVIFSFILHDRGVLARLLGSAPLRVVGLLSYTLYLVHMAIFLALEQQLPEAPAWLRVGLGWAFSFAYAGLMYRAVELPLARRRRRADRISKGTGVN